MMPGGATGEGTRRYFKRLQRTFRNYAASSWTVSPALLPFHASRLGIGTYRAHRDRTDHHDTLREAFLSGINIIDVAPNHSDGAAEVLVGNVLQELFEARRLFRDEVIVVERAGFIEGSTLKLLSGRMPDNTVHLSPSLAHSLHPDFLSMQIDLSLQRLGLQTIDIFLLHNPELQWEEDLRRVNRALFHLEKERQQGRIQFYGISSNALPSADGLSVLEDLLDTAPPGFRVVQFPANLLEREYRPLLAFARKKGLFTLGCRPLNALYDDSILRLARMIDPPPEGEENPEARQMRIEDELLSLEERMLQLINEREHRFSFDSRTPSVYRSLVHYRRQIKDLETVLPVIDGLTVPFQRSVSALRAGLEHCSDPDTGRLLFQRYMRLLHTALGFLPSYTAYRHHLAMEDLERHLQKVTGLSLPLSMLAVQAVLADGMDTVFVGMRNSKAVRQMTGLFARDSFIKIPEVDESWLPRTSAG